MSHGSLAQHEQLYQQAEIPAPYPAPQLPGQHEVGEGAAGHLEESRLIPEDDPRGVVGRWILDRTLQKPGVAVDAVPVGDGVYASKHAHTTVAYEPKHRAQP